MKNTLKEKIEKIIGSLEPWDDDNADKAINKLLSLIDKEDWLKLKKKSLNIGKLK